LYGPSTTTATRSSLFDGVASFGRAAPLFVRFSRGVSLARLPGVRGVCRRVRRMNAPAARAVRVARMPVFRRR
jgi:hypothetical protein